MERALRELVTRQQETREKAGVVGSSSTEGVEVEKDLGAIRSLGMDRQRRNGDRDKMGEMKVVKTNEESEMSLLETLLPDMMVLLSEKDELVPNEQGRKIWEDSAPFRRSSSLSGLSGSRSSSDSDRVTGTKGGVHGRFGVDDADVDGDGGQGRLVVIEKALHEDAWKYRRWGIEMRRYIRDVERKAATRRHWQGMRGRLTI